MFMSYERKQRDGEYEILLITPEAFMNDFSDLIDMYLTQGLRTQIATTQTINTSMTGIDLQQKLETILFKSIKIMEFNM